MVLSASAKKLVSELTNEKAKLCDIKKRGKSENTGSGYNSQTALHIILLLGDRIAVISQ